MNYCMCKFKLTILVLLFFKIGLCAQGENYTLEKVLNLVSDTYAFKLLKKDSLIYNMKHKIFAHSIIPNIVLNGKLPSYDKSISLVSQYDGSYEYRSRTYATSSLSLDVSQLIPFTGGTLKYSMGLSRLDNFTNNFNTHTYYLNLGKLSYSQSLFSYNPYKWAKRQDVQEKKVEGITLIQEQEKIKYDVVNAFFDLLIQQQSYEVARDNLKLSRYIFIKAGHMLKDGRISESDYRDTEIEYIRDSIYNNNVEIDAARKKFSELLRLPEEDTPYVEFVDSCRSFHQLYFNMNDVVANCMKYNYDELHTLKEMQQTIEVKKTKANKAPSFMLEMGGGYNTQFQNFCETFKDRISSSNIALTISVPIYDGNIANYKHKIAQLELEKLYEQNQLDKSSARHSISRDLLNVNVMIESINAYRHTLKLLIKQMSNMKTRVDLGRINVEQYIRIKSQYSQTYLSYLSLIKSYYTYVYKYRYYALYDIEQNIVLYHE